jgi:23S rRNA maturation-related 3'-5' exoribonuclease YhaM
VSLPKVASSAKHHGFVALELHVVRSFDTAANDALGYAVVNCV